KIPSRLTRASYKVYTGDTECSPGKIAPPRSSTGFSAKKRRAIAKKAAAKWAKKKSAKMSSFRFAEHFWLVGALLSCALLVLALALWALSHRRRLGWRGVLLAASLGV